HAAFAADFAKPATEVELTELLPVADEVHQACRQLKRWMKPRRVSPTLTTLGTRARVHCQPRGRCLLVGPWNYPLNCVLGPLVSAVAAGNTVLIKPSEFTPHVNAVIADLVDEVFAPEEVAVVRGGVATAERLLALPFDHIFFTGSPAVGRIVMTAAARHLSSVTLELGGKSPVIVDASADVEAAVRMLVWGKCINAGQSCVAPDHAFVHRSVAERFVGAWRDVVASRFGADAAAVAASADLARMIHRRHAHRVAGLIDEALGLGAELLAGGGHAVEDRHVGPTLLGGVPAAAALQQEEVFGPVLPLIVYDSLDEVLDRIQRAPKPLALYLWARDEEVIARVTRQSSSGGLGINLCMQQYAHGGLPFGGVNQSGIGSAHGWHGFRAFSHERAVLRNGPLNALRCFYPPYTPLRQALARRLTDLVAWLA
ncbi:MAG TPA: aldehyde dehydrogenase family protein, partial [Burkholderiaceae bacterium]|nr:aldehyde dehydrogenase family protein [Burkholderiaceae bacterium]